jgi:hypothetical protein
MNRTTNEIKVGRVTQYDEVRAFGWLHCVEGDDLKRYWFHASVVLSGNPVNGSWATAEIDYPRCRPTKVPCLKNVRMYKSQQLAEGMVTFLQNGSTATETGSQQ